MATMRGHLEQLMRDQQATASLKKETLAETASPSSPTPPIPTPPRQQRPSVTDAGTAAATTATVWTSAAPAPRRPASAGGQSVASTTKRVQPTASHFEQAPVEECLEYIERTHVSWDSAMREMARVEAQKQRAVLREQLAAAQAASDAASDVSSVSAYSFGSAGSLASAMRRAGKFAMLPRRPVCLDDTLVGLLTVNGDQTAGLALAGAAATGASLSGLAGPESARGTTRGAATSVTAAGAIRVTGTSNTGTSSGGLPLTAANLARAAEAAAATVGGITGAHVGPGAAAATAAPVPPVPSMKSFKSGTIRRGIAGTGGAGASGPTGVVAAPPSIAASSMRGSVTGPSRAGGVTNGTLRTGVPVAPSSAPASGAPAGGFQFFVAGSGMGAPPVSAAGSLAATATSRASRVGGARR